MSTKTLGEIPVDKDVFDSSKRSEIDAEVLDEFLDLDNQ